MVSPWLCYGKDLWGSSLQVGVWWVTGWGILITPLGNLSPASALGLWPTKGDPSMGRVSIDPRVGPSGRAGPESDSKEEEIQDSREDPSPMDPMGPPPVSNLGWAKSTSEGHLM